MTAMRETIRFETDKAARNAKLKEWKQRTREHRKEVTVNRLRRLSRWRPGNSWRALEWTSPAQTEEAATAKDQMEENFTRQCRAKYAPTESKDEVEERVDRAVVEHWLRHALGEEKLRVTVWRLACADVWNVVFLQHVWPS